MVLFAPVVVSAVSHIVARRKPRSYVAAALILLAADASAQGRRIDATAIRATTIEGTTIQGTTIQGTTIQGTTTIEPTTIEPCVLLTGTRAEVARAAAQHGLRVHKFLGSGAVVQGSTRVLGALAADRSLSSNYRLRGHMAVTTAAIGADQVWESGWAEGMDGVTGAGIGVAVIDTGVAEVPELRGRIVASMDFTATSKRGGQQLGWTSATCGGAGGGVRGRAADDNGHGTHVAGIIAAAGATVGGRGVAPGAHIINLKVLDANGEGFASDVIEGIDWAIANKERYRIRVINLSLGGPVLQACAVDPVCHAVERAYRAGIVVVASAGNRGKDEDGNEVFGGIGVPGNSPFAITVGCLNTKETIQRSDDVVCTYSSRGPTRFEGLIKPDLVAPGSCSPAPRGPA